MRIDQYVMSWLLSSISEKMLDHVIHSQSSSEIWNVLEHIFSTKSKAIALKLRLSLQTTKKGGRYVEKYILKIKSHANSLMAAG